MDPVSFLFDLLFESGLLAPLVAALIGVALTLAPVSWASIPAAVALVGPARAAAREGGEAALSAPRGFLVILGFVVGLDGVVAALAGIFLSVLTLLTRGAEVLIVTAIIVLVAAALRLLLARSSVLCKRLDVIPLSPVRAMGAGIAFSVGGCPGCAPVAAAVGAAGAALGPLPGLLVLASFLLGRAGALYLAAAAGGRFLVRSDPQRARRLEIVLALGLLAAAGYYIYLLSAGLVLTQIPGEEGRLP